MISPDYYASLVRRVFVTEDATALPATERALAALPGIPCTTVRAPADIPPKCRNRESLFITGRRGEAVGKCPGSKGHLCCGYVTVDCYLGCTIGCSYCIMQSYLNFAPITVYADTAPSIARIREIARANTGKTLRVGTGEAGDSLQFDPLFGLAAEYVDALADEASVSLELKTKTDFVDHLLGLPRKGNAVIAFSMNPQEVSDAEEPGSASIGRRLDAALRSVAAGYRIAFHFDPIILVPGWRELYRATVTRIGAALDTVPGARDRVAWISLGTMRYTPALAERIGRRAYLYDEFVPCRDGKYRYLQPRRSEVYRTLRDALGKITAAPVYLCMESPAVWRNVFGALPSQLEGTRAIFNRITHTGKHVRTNGGIT